MPIGTSTSQGFVKGRRRRVDWGNQRWMGKVQFSDFQKQICSPLLVPHPLKHSKIGENQTKLKAREERAKLDPDVELLGCKLVILSPKSIFRTLNRYPKPCPCAPSKRVVWGPTRSENGEERSNTFRQLRKKH